ncbi:MAG: hypothetical protein M3142_14495 [Bacteroidota bacterium]|nr:hypothetical protein [Bacteroidota bacterium]
MKKNTFYPITVEFLKKKWLTVLLLVIISGAQSHASAFTLKEEAKAKGVISSTNLKLNSFAGEKVIGFTFLIR